MKFLLTTGCLVRIGAGLQIVPRIPGVIDTTKTVLHITDFPSFVELGDDPTTASPTTTTTTSAPDSTAPATTASDSAATTTSTPTTATTAAPTSATAAEATAPGASTVISDWAFCTCGSGQNGTLIYADRDFTPPPTTNVVPELANLRGSSNSTDTVATPAPTVPLTKTPSFLELSIGGQSVQLAQSVDQCECENPWENFSDPLKASTCSVSAGSITVCVVRTANAARSPLSPEEAAKKAKEILEAIDTEFTRAQDAAATTPSP